MRAIAITEPGGPEVLVAEDRAKPEPKAGEILIKVHAAGVNRPDCMQRAGNYPPPPGAPDIPGLEVAGEVEAIVHVSLAELLSDVVWREEIWTWQGATPRALSFFEVPGDTIWGATGSMLRQLLAIATGTDDSILGYPSDRLLSEPAVAGTFVITPYDRGPVYTAGRVGSHFMSDLKRDADGYVLRSDGKRAALLHQYDRCVELLPFYANLQTRLNAAEVARGGVGADA